MTDSQVCASETRTALYRFYDAHEVLLYVGITNDPWRRWRQHVAEKPWYPRVKHQAITWYDSEAEAARAELRAIREERPRFNIAGAVRPPVTRVRMQLTTIAKVACALGITGLVAMFASMFIPHVPTVLVPASGVLMLGAGVTSWTAVMIAMAPLVARFAHWVERTFDATDPEAWKWAPTND